MAASILLKLILLSTIGLGSSQADQIVHLHRAFNDGDKIAYSMHMTETLASADADVDSSWTETVSKATADGANIDIKFTSYKVTAGGMDIPAPSPEAHTYEVDKHGIEPIAEITAVTSVSRLVPTFFAAYINDSPLKQGVSTSLTYTDDSAGASKMTGTAKLDGIDKGIATVESQLKFESPSFDVPFELQIKAYIDVATGQLDHLEGTLTRIPTKLAGRYNVQSAKFSVKRDLN